jgi:hypothetical protein
MNLVQINERLKDLPPQVLKQYADGMNPEVPPYLALGELQRREIAEKKMAATQGGAQGPQPSIKEQLEQKAGLMALQQMQQQQAQQQQPRGPMPAPAGVPQPQAQPQAPFMAARGGLASVPVQFAFKPGGIVAFSNGGDTMGTPSLRDQDLAAQAAELAAEDRKKAAVAAKIAELEKKANELDYVAPEMAGEVRAQIAALTADQPATQRPSSPVPAMKSPQPTQQTYVRGAGPVAPRQERPAPRPDAARPATQPAQTGLPAAASRSPYFAQADAALNEPNVKPTPEGIIAEQKALSPEAMQEEFMKKRMAEQRERAAGERAAFERTRPSGLDDLIRVFGQAGQYKGLSGTGPAYTANEQQKRAQELAMERRQNELMTAIDTREYEGGKELFGARTRAMESANKSFQDRLKSRAETLAQLANVDQRSMDSVLDRLNNMQIAQLRSAAESRPSEAERIEATYIGLIAQNKPKEAEEFLARISRIKRGGDKEDTLGKEIAKKRVEIASMPMSPKMKQDALDNLAALERQQGGGSGSASQSGKVPPPPPGFKVN